jgi:hypothetical protein
MEFGIIGLIHLILVIWALFDIITSARSLGWKVLWGVIVFLLPCIGLLLYFFIGRKME